MSKRKINIYSIDVYGNHIYEGSTETNLNCSQTQMKFISKNSLLSNVINSTKRMVYFKKPVTNKRIFKNTNVVKIYASLK